MVFFLECVVACVLFTAALEALAAKRREVFVNDYPPVVTEKLRALGIVAEKPPARKSDIIRKLIAVVVFALVIALALRRFNGITTFSQWYFIGKNCKFVFFCNSLETILFVF